MISRIALIEFSLILLGAHFLRSMSLLQLAATSALIVLVFVRRPWSNRVLQVGLVLGALEWILTIVNLVWSRMGLGQPYMRMLLILGAVTALTVGSLFILRGSRARAWYRFRGLESSNAEAGQSGATADP
jgi:hypothetical protein